MTGARTVIKVGSKTITINGGAEVTTQVVRLPGEVEVRPNHIVFTGSYANTHTGLNFNGSATFDVTWVANGFGGDITNGNSHLTGELTKNGHPTYSLDVGISKTPTSVATNMTLAAGTDTLSGHGSATLNPSTGDLTQATLTLTSSVGAVITLNANAALVLSGNIKVGGETEATITDTGSLLRISYIDSSFKEFPY